MSRSRSLIGFSALALCQFAGTNLAVAQCDKAISANDFATLDQFGKSTLLTGSWAFAGSPRDDRPALTNAGAVYWYTRAGLDWTQAGKIVAPDATSDATFGWSIAYAGRIAIGAPAADGPNGADTGAVYIYEFNAGAWNFQNKITAPDGALNDKFGFSVAMFENWLVVGAPEDDNEKGVNAGAAYVYCRNNQSWTLVTKILNADGAVNDRNGWDVAISSGFIATSAYYSSSGGFHSNGSVYLYNYTNSNSGVMPSLDARITASNPYNDAGFSGSIALDDSRLLVGDPFATVNGTSYAGRFYLYTRTGPGAWSEKIGVPAPVVGRRYGTSVDLNLAYMIIGGESGVAVFRDQFQAPVLQHMIIEDPSPTDADSFGNSVSIQGLQIIVGDERQNPVGFDDSGNAHIFQLNDPDADSCATADYIDVTNGTPILGCTSSATPSGAGPGCAVTSGSNDVFFAFVPKCTGVYNFATANSDFDTVISVHGACPANAGTTLGCNDDVVAGNHDSSLSVSLIQGGTYYIRVGGYQLNSGLFQLTVEAAGTPPANDNCIQATAIGNGSFPMANCFATDDAGVYSSCSFGHHDVWFRYTASCTGIVSADVCQRNFDSTIDVFPASCFAISQPPIVCNDDSCELGARVQFFAQANAQFLIRVGGWGSRTGSGTLAISCNGCPCNWNHDAALNSQDFFDFLSGFFQNNADYNLDGATNSQDYFDFLGCFFAGC